MVVSYKTDHFYDRIHRYSNYATLKTQSIHKPYGIPEPLGFVASSADLPIACSVEVGSRTNSHSNKGLPRLATNFGLQSPITSRTQRSKPGLRTQWFSASGLHSNASVRYRRVPSRSRTSARNIFCLDSDTIRWEAS